VIAAAGAGMTTVEHELLGRQARLARFSYKSASCRSARATSTTDAFTSMTPGSGVTGNARMRESPGGG
jgi:hypothetical protein